MTGTHRENRRQVTGTRKRSDLCKVQRLDRRVKRERERAREESAFLKETLFRRCALIVANRERNRKREGVDSRRKGRKRCNDTLVAFFSVSLSPLSLAFPTCLGSTCHRVFRRAFSTPHLRVRVCVCSYVVFLRGHAGFSLASPSFFFSFLAALSISSLRLRARSYLPLFRAREGSPLEQGWAAVRWQEGSSLTERREKEREGERVSAGRASERAGGTGTEEPRSY